MFSLLLLCGAIWGLNLDTVKPGSLVEWIGKVLLDEDIITVQLSLINLQEVLQHLQRVVNETELIQQQLGKLLQKNLPTKMSKETANLQWTSILNLEAKIKTLQDQSKPLL